MFLICDMFVFYFVFFVPLSIFLRVLFCAIHCVFRTLSSPNKWNI